MNSYIDHETGRPRLAAPLGRKANQLLRHTCNSKEADIFWKHRGHDHFLLFSITAYQMVGIMVKEFFMFVCQNCTVITIETSPTKTAIPGRTRKKWFAVPYPSSYHWHENIKQLPWLPQDGFNSLQISNNRPILALFIGSVKPSQASSKKLRMTLYNQCKEDPNSCHWYETAHSCNGVVNATNQMLLFLKSQFCPAPAGDSVTRKSIFDSLVAGCIPVLFSRASLNQYSWHISDEEVDKVAVFIPMLNIINGTTNFLDILRSISAQEIIEKQRYIAEIAPRLQYAVVPKHINLNKDHWSPPVPDAADIIINKILDKETIEPILGYSDKEILLQHEEQKYMLTNHPDYGAMASTVIDDTKAMKRKKKKIKGNNNKYGLKEEAVFESGAKVSSLTKIAHVCRE